MFEVESFGNLVNSLRSVRDDYHEHLKTVPQYGAFLLIESSTATVAGTLQSIVSPTSPLAGEVIEALELARSKFQQHLTSVPEYRALLAIDRLITEVATDLGAKAPVETTAPVETAAPATVTEEPVAETTTEQPTQEVETAAVSTPDVQTTEAPEPVTLDAVATAETAEPETTEPETTEPETAEELAVAAAVSELPAQADETPATAPPTVAETEELTQEAISHIEHALREAAETTDTVTSEEHTTAHASTDATPDTTTSHDEEHAAPEARPDPYGAERAA